MRIQLTDAKCAEIIAQKIPGVTNGGNGLHFVVKPSTSKDRPDAMCASWVFHVYMRESRVSASGTRRSVRRLMGLGGFPEVPAREAYRLAAVAKGLAASGIDPIAERRDRFAATARARQQERETQAQRANTPCFRDVTRGWLAKNEKQWTNRRYSLDIGRSLQAHVFPVKVGGRVFGDLPVSEIDLAAVRKVLDPLWKHPDDGGKPQLADKLRSRIESVLDFAAAEGFRPMESNPARWSGLLKQVYLLPSKLAPTKNHPSLIPQHAARFFRALQEIEGNAARALEFLILTTVRTASVLEATWADLIDDEETWFIADTKTGKPGKLVPQWVPLTPAMKRVLEIQRRNVPTDGADRIFPIGESTMHGLCSKICDQIGVPHATPHGMRATFSTTSAMLGWDRILTESALSHAVGNGVARAYDRADQHRNLLGARRDLMAKWDSFLTVPYLRAVA